MVDDTVYDLIPLMEEDCAVSGVIAQFGGQTPLNLASRLEENGVNILGTSPEIIDLAEDRDRFRMVMDKLGIPMPESGMATDVDEIMFIFFFI